MPPMEQRTRWTDDRIDDLAARMDAGFDRIDRDIRDLRADMTTQLEGLRSEVHALGQTMVTTMLRFGLGMLLGFISVLAAIAARG